MPGSRCCCRPTSDLPCGTHFLLCTCYSRLACGGGSSGADLLLKSRVQMLGPSSYLTPGSGGSGIYFGQPFTQSLTHLAHHLRLFLLNPHQGHSQPLPLPPRQGFETDEQADSVVTLHLSIYPSIYPHYRLTSELWVTWFCCTLFQLS